MVCITSRGRQLRFIAGFGIFNAALRPRLLPTKLSNRAVKGLGLFAGCETTLWSQPFVRTGFGHTHPVHGLQRVLRQRGVPEVAARVAAELSSLACKIAYERWSATPEGQDFKLAAGGALDEVQAASLRWSTLFSAASGN